MGKSVRIGLIGTSWWVDLMYVPSLTSHPAVRVVGVCGRNEVRAKEIAANFGDARVFTDYHQLIDSGNLDAIVIASPDDLHHEMAIAAIDAGLHVLCEKPLAGNATHAREIWERAEAAQVKHMVLFTWRWQPHWRYLKELVEEGYIGRCYYADFEFLSSFALDDGYKWRFDGDRANGVTGDLGSHMIDFARWYLGEISEVMANLTTFVDQSATAEPPPVPANDVGLLTLKFVSGARAQIRVSAASRLGDEGARIIASLHGEAGTIEVRHTYFGADAGVVFRSAKAGDTTFTPLDIPTRYFEDGVDPKQLFDPYTKQSAGPRLFVDAILSGSDPMPGFDVGVAIQEVVDAALKSNTEKRWVSLIDEQA
jgi:predicted dehydrogenase